MFVNFFKSKCAYNTEKCRKCTNIAVDSMCGSMLGTFAGLFSLVVLYDIPVAFFCMLLCEESFAPTNLSMSFLWVPAGGGALGGVVGCVLGGAQRFFSRRSSYETIPDPEDPNREEDNYSEVANATCQCLDACNDGCLMTTRFGMRSFLRTQ